MEKKYKLTEETINVIDKTLYRIEALRDFSDVKKGDKGGYVKKEENLSQSDDCWVYNDAMVYDNAMVFGNAKVCDNAIVYGNTIVSDNVRVYGNAVIFGYAAICGDTVITSNSDYIVFKNWWSSGRYFTWTKSNNMWKVGCFHGTGKELIEKAYKDSEISGREYERVVKYVESIIADDGKEVQINRRDY